MRLPLCHENPIRRWHWTLRPHSRAHVLNSLLYFIPPLSSLMFFFSFKSDYSQQFKRLESRGVGWLPLPEVSLGLHVWPVEGKNVTNDTIWKIEWTFIVHRHLFYLTFLNLTHITFFWDKHTLHLCGFRVKASKLWTVVWMCVNRKKQGKRHVLLHIVTLIFKE